VPGNNSCYHQSTCADLLPSIHLCRPATINPLVPTCYHQSTCADLLPSIHVCRPATINPLVPTQFLPQSPFAGKTLPQVMMLVTRDKKRPELGETWGAGIGGNEGVPNSPTRQSTGGLSPRQNNLATTLQKEPGEDEQGFTSRPSLLQLKALMEKCWAQKPTARPSFKLITTDLEAIIAMHRTEIVRQRFHMSGPESSPDNRSAES
jgi:hypothetical protein